MRVAQYFANRVTVPDHIYSFRDVYCRNAFAHEAATSLRQWQERGFVESFEGKQLQLTDSGREKLAACLRERE